MECQSIKMLLIVIACFVIQIFAAPNDYVQSLVISTTTPSQVVKESGKEGEQAHIPAVPKIYQMHIRTNISNRYAHTTIISKVKNIADKAQEATFSVVLPEKAFISGFIMEVGDVNYTAYVKEKEEAKKQYEQAVASGLGAAHVAVSARDSNRFTVSVNVEPETKAAFYLSYEQLLIRQDGHYEQIINIHPGQLVKDLGVEVIITERRKIIDLRAPPIRSGNEIGNDKAELDPRANIEIVNETAAIITFNPNEERQKQLANYLGTKEDNGFSGQFVIQYDVERDPSGGEVLVQDGFFVHFFAPTELAPLPKQVVFVLDTSSSMYDRKIEQLREAMLKIIEDLHEHDSFNLVEFNTNVKVWDLYNEEASVWFPTTNNNYDWGSSNDVIEFDNFTFPAAYPANADNIKKAKDAVPKLVPTGSTDIYSALRVGLHLVELEKAKTNDGINRQPIIVFLTDGEPTVRLTSTEEISNKISEYNVGPRKAPIFALSFGRGADKNFLQKLAIRNSGYSKHIYEGADASLQLQDFYKQISSPLLSDVTFKYEPSVTSLTKTTFPIHFRGSEIIVAGWCGTVSPRPLVYGWGLDGQRDLKPVVRESITSMERLWGYLTISQLLEKMDASNNDEDKKSLKEKALDLALKYSFVTSVSSLVVVKPNDTSAVNTETAEGGRLPSNYGFVPNRVAIAGIPGPPGMSGSFQHGGGFSSFAKPMIAYEAALDVDAIASRPPQFLPPQSTTAFVPTVHTTVVSATETSTTKENNLFNVLPWLKQLLSAQGTIELPNKGNFKLGLNETISDLEDCPNTPLNEAGQCSLIHECPQVHNLLLNEKVYLDHSCILKNEYAGICCPKQS